MPTTTEKKSIAASVLTDRLNELLSDLRWGDYVNRNDVLMIVENSDFIVPIELKEENDKLRLKIESLNDGLLRMQREINRMKGIKP
jgi:hypothetical protein